MGVLSLPKIEVELVIVEGTNSDDLKKRGGHYKQNVYSNERGQIVLYGHRDPVSRRTGEPKTGDMLKMSLLYRDFTYKITKIKMNFFSQHPILFLILVMHFNAPLFTQHPYNICIMFEIGGSSSPFFS
ncbi:sortase [Priestia endophytica]|uniref:sortase n=1 Tax=Priestia endophytica TaxID=135735 RepID=UPI001F5B1FEE|nr:sortase [Priestia endophytica]